MKLFGSRRPPAPPERSARLRLFVAAAAVPAMLALGWVGFIWVPVALALLGLAAGHYYSWRSAHRPRASTLARLIIFVALHAALLWMCAGLFVAGALPQAEFALFAQAITSFDLRTRGNLFASLAMSLLSLYVAATLSRDSSLIVFVLAFLLLVLAVFYQAELESGRAHASAPGQALYSAPPGLMPISRPASSGAAARLRAVGYAAILVILAALVFAFTPRFAGRPMLPPFSLDLPIPRGTTAQIVNPAVPLVQINGWSDGENNYYYGFDQRLDLTYRGGLSDAVVMYVRSPAWSYWRSHSYDTYTGAAWEQSDTRVLDLAQDNRRIYFEIPADSQALGEEVVQSFFLVSDQPNLVFAAYRPVEAYLNTGSLALDAGDGLRVGEPMSAGTTYTIVSRRPTFSAEALRQAGSDYPADVAARYLQLPANLSPRVRDLARSLTALSPTPYDQAAALRDYLLTIPYDFFPPPHPPGAETVDTFLFVDQRGVCEQFATSLAVMLRSLGVPTRLVAGYGAGDYNALSGYYTVRASHAHAWVEVYFPGYGWVPFDPTPGWTPDPFTAPVQRWLFSSSARGLPDLPLGALAAAGRAVAGAAFGPMLFIVALAMLIAAAWLLRLAWQLRRAERLPGLTALDGHPHRRRILAAYHAGQRRLKRYRALAETPREFAQRVPIEGWDEVTTAVEQSAYRPAIPERGLAERVEEIVRRVRSTPAPKHQA